MNHRANLRSIFLLLIFTLLWLLIFVNRSNAQTYVMSNTTVTTCSGTFTDPGGAGDYPMGNTSTMTISPASAGYVSVSFTSFDVQADWDALYVYDGNSTAAPLIGIFSGTTSPGVITASTANASRSLTFYFVSNWWFTAAEPGWTATISCAAAGASPMYGMRNGMTYTVCSGTFYDSGGSTHAYTWNENSTMTFCPATAGNGIQLAFSPIDLEQDNDLLYIYDGPSAASPLIAGFGNSDNVVLPAQTITASTANTTGCLTARFQSDGWWQNPGWSAAISCVPKTAPTYGSMDGTITTCAGTFTDNGGGNSPYMDFSDDEFTICSDNAATPYVTVNFTGIDLWTGFDFLRVYDGTTTAAPLIATYTGIYGATTVSAASASGCLTFKFTSDNWTQRYGWSASIGCTNLIGLPVEWLSFTGARTEDGIVLDWRTASETGAWYFAVERYNGAAFDSIGSLPAAGYSSQPFQYYHIDRSPLPGWNYYRLKQVDLNGQYTYSAVVAVAPEIITPGVNILFSDAGSPTLQFDHLEMQQLSITVYQATGALTAQLEHTPSAAHEKFPLDVALAPGLYLLDVTAAPGFRKTLVYIQR